MGRPTRHRLGGRRVSEQTFLLPDLGEGLTEAEITEWKVNVGDTVAVDQVIVEVEIAKAAVELPVPFAGIVVALHGDAGSTLTVGAPVITVASQHQPAASGRGARGQGDLAGGSKVGPRQRHRSEQTFSPTGACGVITRADVDRTLGARASAPPDEQRIPITGLRTAIAEKLSTSRREIPDVTIWVDVDATALVDAKNAIAKATKHEVSLLSLLARFAIAGLREFPELNSSVDTGRSEIVRYRHVNLGIAVQTSRGLLVPVIEGADTLDTSDAVSQTVRGARDGKLPPSRLSRGTFTLNNYGVFGVDGSTPIINIPRWRSWALAVLSTAPGSSTARSLCAR
jgi:2-oxoisovalerate dehydrogenase E2 component (dihydrolipoyl transacylase)